MNPVPSEPINVSLNASPESVDSEQRLKVALKEVSDIKAALDEHSIVAVTDATGRITYANDKFCAISQYSLEELIGKDHRIINSRHHSKEFFQDLWLNIQQGKVWRAEICNRAKDGSLYWVDTTVFPILNDDGTPARYIAIRTDITSRKKNEAQLERLARELAEKNKDLESVVYIVSHDLRAPLVNIQGFGKKLERACEEIRSIVKKSSIDDSDVTALAQPLDIAIPQSLRFIQAGISKMDALLDGFLRFSRLGRIVLNVVPLDLNDMLSAVVASLQFQIDQAGAKVLVDRLPFAMGDGPQINQVFSNLIDNALKYRAPDRPLRINIQGWIDGDRAIFSISDNGMGIAPEHQPKIFEIFHRLDPQATKGEGLGLTIAQRILERQNGKLWVESEAGIGSTFHLSLPAVSKT